MDLEGIRKLTKEGRYHYSLHAKEMILLREIPESTVVDTILRGEVIESYEEDPRGKSYLILGERPLHVLVGYNRYRGKAIVITTYIPEPPKWITPRKRGQVKDEG